MNPPPPIFPFDGLVTASAKPVAIAASTAFPPALSTSAPASLAILVAETTIPWEARTAEVSCWLETSTVEDNSISGPTALVLHPPKTIKPKALRTQKIFFRPVILNLPLNLQLSLSHQDISTDFAIFPGTHELT